MKPEELDALKDLLAWHVRHKASLAYFVDDDGVHVYVNGRRVTEDGFWDEDGLRLLIERLAA